MDWPIIFSAVTELSHCDHRAHTTDYRSTDRPPDEDASFSRKEAAAEVEEDNSSALNVATVEAALAYDSVTDLLGCR